jgi:hypothetical protein
MVNTLNTSFNYHPISWNEELGAYVYDIQGYNGPSTKKTGRIASDISIQHFIARQLELIAKSLNSFDEIKEIDSHVAIPLVHRINI